MKAKALVLALLMLSGALGLMFLTTPTAAVETQAFYSDIRIDNDIVAGNYAATPRVAVFNTTVYVMWCDQRHGDMDIFVSNSTDGGLTFAPSVRVDDTDRNINGGDDDTIQQDPAFAIDAKGVLHAVWEDRREGYNCIYYSRSTDGGSTWSANKRIDDLSLGNKENPDIDIGPNNEIFVVFEDERSSGATIDKDIYFTMSTNGGMTFLSSDVRVDDAPADTKQIEPSVSSDSEGNIYVAWSDERIGDLDIYSAVSTDAGMSFNWPCVKASDDPTIAAQTNADTLCINNTFYVCWYDNRGDKGDVRMSHTTDLGLSFNDSVNVASGPSGTKQYYPSMARGPGGSIYIAWADNRNITSDIDMTWTTDGGQTFHNDTLVNDVSLDSEQISPSIAVDTWGKIHVAFMDNRNGDYDIFYSRSIAGGMPGAAATLSDATVSPGYGNADTEFKYSVTYTDVDNDPPGPGYPKLYIYREITPGQWVDFPNSPFNMSHQSVPAQDYTWSNGEVYQYLLKMEREYNYTFMIETRAAWGNTTMNHTELYNAPLVDETPVEFLNQTPGDGIWHNDTLVPVGIDISDTGGTGVDVSTIQYSISTSGPDGFDRWIPFGTAGISDGPLVHVEKDLLLGNGSNNYVKWRASDIVGNGISSGGFQESEPVRVHVDTFAPTFSSPLPRDGSEVLITDESQLETIYPNVEIWDTGGSGVDRDTIYFRFSTTGPNTFGPWVKVASDNITSVASDNQSFRPLVHVVPDASDDAFNYIQWCASDLMGNRRESNAYHINIVMDIPPPSNYPPTPPNALLPTDSSSLTPFLLWSGATDVEGSELTYYLAIGSSPGSTDILAWMDMGESNTYQILPSLNLSYGTYHVQIMANDGFLNSTVFEHTLVLSGTGNTPPTPPVSITPDVVDDHWPRIRWEGARDADNDTLIYFIQIGSDPGGSDIQPWISTGTRGYFDAVNYMASGTYYVQLRSCDSLAFSNIREETLEIGKFDISISTVASIKLMSGGNGTYNILATNKGTTFDTITLSLDGNAVNSGINISLGFDELTLAAGAKGNVSMTLIIPEDIPIGTYRFRIISASRDGVTRYVVPVTIVVYDPAKSGEDGDGGGGNDGSGDVSDQPIVKSGIGPLLVAMVLAAVIGIGGVMIYLKLTEPKKNRPPPQPGEEESEDREEETEGEISDEGERPRRAKRPGKLKPTRDRGEHGSGKGRRRGR